MLCKFSRIDEIFFPLISSEKKPAALVKWEALKDAPDDVLKNGNLSDFPSSTLLLKIKSDNKKRLDVHPDFYMAMGILKKMLEEKYLDAYGCEKILDYIQVHGIQPLMIFLYSELQLRFVQGLDRIFLNFDATGSTEKQPPSVDDEKLTIYHFSVFLPGGEGISLLEIAEAILSRHDAVTVQWFLANVLNDLKKVTSKKIAKFEIDFSPVLTKACCLVANEMNLLSYMDALYNEVEDGISLNQHIVIIHVCSPHVIKTSRKKIIKCFLDKEKHQRQRYIASRLISQLIYSKNFEEAKTPFDAFIRIYGLPFEDIDFANLQKCDQSLISEKQDSDEIAGEESSEEPSDDTGDDEKETPGEDMKKSKYYLQFLDEKNKIIDEAKTTKKKNIFHYEELVHYLLDFLLAYYPLCSAVGISRFGLLRDSNASAENGFKIFKWYILEGIKRWEIPRLILRMEGVIRAKIRERMYRLETARQMKKRGNGENAVKEEKNFGELHENSEKDGSEKRIMKINETSVKKEPAEALSKVTRKGERTGRKKEEKIEQVRNELIALLEEQQDELGVADDDFSTIMPKKKNMDLEKEEKEVWKKKSTQSRPPGGNRYFKEKKFVNGKDQPKPLSVAKCVRPEMHIHERAHRVKRVNPTVYIELEDAEVFFREGQIYPPNFPDFNRILNGAHVMRASFQRLKPYIDDNQFLDDEVVNAFFPLLPEIALRKNVSLVSFSTFFFQFTNNNKVISSVDHNWAEINEVSKKNVWLIPVNYEIRRHWYLLIVVFSLKTIIHLDSLHWPLQANVKNGLCTFMRSLDKDIKWSEWSIYSAKDNPSQRTAGGAGGNCGVHVCTIGLLAALCCGRKFTEADMGNARKAIANVIYHAHSNPAIEKTVESGTKALLADLDGAKPNEVKKKSQGKKKKGPYGIQDHLPIYPNRSLKTVEEPPLGCKGIFELFDTFGFALNEQFGGQRLRRRGKS
ncbi:hypothetical protein QAD02_003567 [Eretmocerus hayati]|uniref:Uncharacterized protein n=1 Tax=Eretmocerus hayati TaxID=131215 RepID=A0ACC2NM71_9HYME|nr:hypothetical protein QAD02_003567 [Eretmocerus hayati]